MFRWITSVPYTQHIVYALLTLLIAFVAAYGYFLQQTINTVVDRSRTEQTITQLRSDIGDAEQAFGANVGSATVEKARKLGFRETNTARFVSRSPAPSTLVTANVQNE
jgi:predicted lysophospholipase L1 biosynthesis ABC-type transport system permease subunit